MKDIGDVNFSTVEETVVVKGGGIIAKVAGHRIAVGNVALMEQENIAMNDKARQDIERFEQNGNSLVIAAMDGKLKALLGIRDQIRYRCEAGLAKVEEAWGAKPRCPFWG